MRKPFTFEVNISFEGTPLEPSLRNLEFSMILDALSKTRGRKSKAARLLKVPRSTLVEKMKRLGLPTERAKRPDQQK